MSIFKKLFKGVADVAGYAGVPGAGIVGSILGKKSGGGGSGPVDLTSHQGIAKFKRYDRGYKYKIANQRGYKTPKEMVLTAEAALGKQSSIVGLKTIFGKSPSPVNFIKKTVRRGRGRARMVKARALTAGQRRRRGLTPALPVISKPLSPIQQKVFNKPTTLTPGQRRRKKRGAFVTGLPNLGIGGLDPSDVQFTKPGFSIFGKKGTQAEATNKKLAVAGGVGLGVVGIGVTLLRLLK